MFAEGFFNSRKSIPIKTARHCSCASAGWRASNLPSPHVLIGLDFIENYLQAGFSQTKIAEKLDAQFFFAQPYLPWKRGLNDYNNKLIRYYLSKKTDLNRINHETINMMIGKLNNRPRKFLEHKTSNEVFLANFNINIAPIS